MRSRNYKQQKPDCYICGTSRKAKRECSSHYIRESLLIDCVLFRINVLLELSSSDFESFKKTVKTEFRRKVEVYKEINVENE